MKKLSLIFFTMVLIIGLVTPVYAQLTPAKVAEKTIYHTVSLVDAYINAMPEPRAVFPDGYFNFWLRDGSHVGIGPGFVDGRVYRTISFSLPPDAQGISESESIFLDGPINMEPGNINPNIVAEVTVMLEEYLTRNDMRITIIMREEVELDLSLERDFQQFYDAIKDAIDARIPVRIEGVIKTIPIEPDVEVNFVNGPGILNINEEDGQQQSIMKINEEIVTTNEEIEIKESKLYIKTSMGSKEIKISPEEASSKAGIETVKEIILIEELQKPLPQGVKGTGFGSIPAYLIKGTKQVKLFSIIPISMKVETKINAETGSIISTNKPFWSLLVL